MIHSIDVATVVVFVTAFAAVAAAPVAFAIANITDVIASNDLVIDGERGQGDRERERRSFRRVCNVTKKCGEVSVLEEKEESGGGGGCVCVGKILVPVSTCNPTRAFWGGEMDFCPQNDEEITPNLGKSGACLSVAL